MPEPLPSAAARIGAVIIGDELLSGKRQDKHMPKLIEVLGARGLELSWVRLLGDDPGLLTVNLRETFASGHVVFSFGGIGATPDDRTRQCAAAALGLELEVHPEGLAELEARFGSPVLPHRIRMVEFPRGAAIIPNPVNRVPGFSIRDHHFLPGFPRMAWPMVEWVLDQRYAHLHGAGAVERAITVLDCREGQLIALLEEFERHHPQLRLSCLPHSEGVYQVELGLRGEPDLVAQALDELTARIEQMGFSWRPVALTSRR
jgi:molybdopterin-biosynthesis enzyme MoeA-like protein